MSSVFLVNVGLDLAYVWTCRLCGGTQHQISGSLPSSFHLEVTKFSFSLYVPWPFWAAAPSLEFRAKVLSYQFASKPFSRMSGFTAVLCLILIFTAFRSGDSSSRTFYSRLGSLAPQGRPLQLRYLIWFLTITYRCGTSPFHVSTPPNSLNVPSLYPQL